MAQMIIEKMESHNRVNPKKNNQNKRGKRHKRANTVNIKRFKRSKQKEKNYKKRKRIRNKSRNSTPSSLLLSQSNSNILGTEALPEEHTNDNQYENQS
eukprot:103813_1